MGETPAAQECQLCREGGSICAPSPLIPCGVRGMPVCIDGSDLCKDLLEPAFPLMICVDSLRSDPLEVTCGTLSMPACLELQCSAPFVVHPSTKLCVPDQDEPCGGANEPECHWNGEAPCDPGLSVDRGMCVAPA